VARRKEKTPCDLGDHQLFDTLGGDQLCALGCGYRVVGGASKLKIKNDLIRAAMEKDDAALLAMLEEQDEV